MTATLAELTEGAMAPVISHKLTRTDLVKYAGASHDFNPMHHDEILAVKAGQPSVFGHGMLSMGILGRAITDWIGAGSVRHYKVRFTTQSWPGDQLTTQVTVTGTREQDGEQLVDLDCQLVNGDGKPVVMGSATAVVGGAA